MIEIPGNLSNRWEPLKVRIVNISPEMLIALLQMDGSQRVRIDGMPADAKIVGISDQPFFAQNLISIRVESESFRPLQFGEHIPTHELSLSCFTYPDEPLTLEKTP